MKKSGTKRAFIQFLEKHKAIIVAAIIFLVTTITLLWPAVLHPATYSPGGDHMFNAWTLARNHHCILGQNCTDYSDGNIYFPNQDSMLYSETQFSTGLLTLPLYLINNNPLFATNIWMILTVFLSGVFMYLLAKYLSKGNEVVSILSGLVFAFGPTKMTAIPHLQSLSIFYVPIIVLLLLKFHDTGQKKYLIPFGILSALFFLASWYQMVFGLVVIGAFILYVALSDRRRALALSGVTTLAVLIALPLALQYASFSKQNQATFSVRDQIAFSAAIEDYFMPQESTPLGMMYYKLRPFVLKNSTNPDSYAYAGVTLYTLLCISLVYVLTKRRNKQGRGARRLIWLCILLFFGGVIFSLGPVLKIGSSAIQSVDGIDMAFPLPYLAVDQLVPQLSFIRALGRATVIALFALCCLLALLGRYLNQVKPKKKRWLATGLVFVVVSFDLLPVKQFVITPFQDRPSRETSYSVPALYEYIYNHPEINNMVILRTEPNYPDAAIVTARVEDVLWAGYHNRNIFNGYSGFEPRDYQETLDNFIDLQSDDVAKMKSEGLQYLIVDKELSDSQPNYPERAEQIIGTPIYQDQRYILFKL